MKVWFKRSLLGLVVIFIVALVGAAIFLLTFDPNAYKRKLEEIVYERYQRSLAIEGEIELSLFPRIGLSVNGVSLSERNSEQTFMSVDSARFAVAIWPLMSNQFVVDHVSLNGFKVWLEREKDGSFNFSDLLEDSALDTHQPTETAHTNGWVMGSAMAAEVEAPPVAVEPEPIQPEPAKADEPSSELSKVLASLKEAVRPDTGNTQFQIDIAGLDFREGEVHYYDQILEGGGQIVGLDMNTGRMTFGQPFDLKFKGRLQGTKPHMEAALDGQALLRLDPYSHIYAAQRINVQLQGDVGSYKTEQLQLKGGVEYQSLVGVVRVQGMELSSQGELASRTMPLANVQASLSIPDLIYAGQHSLLRIQRMALRTKGNYEHDSVELALDVPDVYMDSTTAEMKSPIVGSFIRSGVNSTGIKLRVEDLSGTAEQLRAERFSVDTVLKQPLQAWVVKVVSPLVWQREQKELQWEALNGVFSLEDEGLPNQRVQADVAGSLSWATASNRWDTHLEIGESAGRIIADGRYQPTAPNIDFTLQIDNTDFANWIPSAEVRKQRGRVVSGEQQEAAEKFVGPVAGTVMDLSFLDKYTVQGKAQLQNVKVGKLSLDQLKADLGVSQGELLLKLNSAEFYQGSLLSELRLKSDSSLRASVDAYGVESGAILEDAFGQTRMSGKSDVSARVTASGHTPAAWLRSLHGSFNLDTVNGRVYGLDAFETLASVVDVAKNAFSPQLPPLALGFDLGRSTSFSALSLQSNVRDGVLSFTSMLANSPDLRVTMRRPSSINLVEQSLDVTLEFRLLSQMRGNAHANLLKELFRVTVPVQLTGPLSHPEHRIVWNEIGSKLVQQALANGLVEKMVGQPLLDTLMDARDTSKALGKKVEQAPRSLGVLFRDLVGGVKP